MARRHRSILVLYAATAGAACGDLAAPLPAPELTARRAQLSVLATPGSLDARFLELARRAEGFAGYHIDRDALVISIRRDADTAHVATVAFEDFRSEAVQPRNASVASPRLRLVAFDWPRLLAFKNAVKRLDAQIYGITYLDADEGSNRIRIGISSLSMAGSLAAALRVAGVPTDAFEIHQEDPAEVFTDLDQYFRPVVGGLGGYYQAGGSFYDCTVGIASQPSGQSSLMLMINSHCTATPFDAATFPTTYWFQSDGGVYEHLIGTKGLDKTAFTSENPECPSGERCRYSDAAFLNIAGPNVGNETAGRIARTLFPGSTTGSKTLDDPSNFFQVTGNRGVPLQGEILDKVGRRTGWTQGTVSVTCTDMRQTASQVYLICQDRVAAGSDEGDSGSPVFSQFSGTSVKFLGILWGGLAGTYFNFSSYGLIREDYGSVRTF